MGLIVGFVVVAVIWSACFLRVLLGAMQEADVQRRVRDEADL